jgi:PAS domain S-box-containing protein
MPGNAEVKASTGSAGPSFDEAEQIIDAIRNGCVDAFVVEEETGEAVYALQTADLPYSTLVQKMQQGAAMLNSTGEVIYCNPSLAGLLGLANENIVGHALQDFIQADDRAACQNLLRDAQPSNGELHLLCSDGSLVPARLSVTTLSRDKSILGVLVTDLTVEKSYVELTSRMQTLQDEERRGIARELHDSIGQLLAAITMNLSRFRKENPNVEPGAAALIADSQVMLNQVSKEIRTISHLLHPPLLDVAGLSSAIQWYADGFSQRSKIKVDLHISSDIGRLPTEAEIAVFRIIQECLTNVYRHSGSHQCSISMTRQGNALQVEVKDQGRGIPKFVKPTAPSSPGLGFRGMRERLRRVGGTLDIQSSENGTVVRAILPISKAA